MSDQKLKLKAVDLRMFRSKNPQPCMEAVDTGVVIFTNQYDNGPPTLRVGCPDPDATVDEFVASFEAWAVKVVDRIREANPIEEEDVVSHEESERLLREWEAIRLRQDLREAIERWEHLSSALEEEMSWLQQGSCYLDAEALPKGIFGTLHNARKHIESALEALRNQQE